MELFDRRPGEDAPDAGKEKSTGCKTAAWVLGIVLAALLLGWQFLFVGKGIDVSDTGYYLANYKWTLQIRELSTVGTFLTGIVGGLLYRLCESGQMLALRIVEAVAQGATAILVWRILSPRKNLIVLLSLLCGSLFLKRMPMLLSYNTFSMLLLTLTVFLLCSGLNRGKKYRVLLAGAVAALNVFFRLPNVLQCCLSVGVLLYGFRAGWPRKKVWGWFGLFVAGYAAGIVAGLTAMLCFAGPEALLRGFGTYAKMGSSAASQHGVGNMAYAAARQLLLGFKKVAAFTVPSLVLAAVLAAVRKKYPPADPSHPKKGVRGFLSAHGIVLAGVLWGLCCAGLMSGRLIDDFATMYMAFAVMVGVIGLLLFRATGPEHLLLAWVLLSCVACVSLGTSNGMHQFAFCGAPILALTSCLLIRFADAGVTAALPAPFRYLHIRFLCVGTLAFLLACGFSVAGRHLLFNYTYREAAYSELTNEPKAPELAGMHTTPERAALLDAFYEQMQAPAFTDRSLIVSGRFPMGYVICDNPPLLSSTWPDLESYSIAVFSERLSESETRGDLPLIAVVDVEEDASTSASVEEKRRLLMDFAERNQYVLWRDDPAFKLYVPPECATKG